MGRGVRRDSRAAGPQGCKVARLPDRHGAWCMGVGWQGGAVIAAWVHGCMGVEGIGGVMLGLAGREQVAAWLHGCTASGDQGGGRWRGT